MDVMVSKDELLKRIRNSRADWERLLNSIPRTRMAEPFMGEWSVKDVIAHLTWHEKQMLQVLHKKALEGSDWWGLTLDERNMNIFQENRARDLDEVIGEHHAVYRNLIEAIEHLDDADLNDPARIRELPPDWRLWKLLAENTYEHYDDHVGPVRAWIGRER
jgi:hypothetical protein